MTKKFNIHDWQAKHLFEQDDFTPDLEDDELKRSKIQQMMAKEKIPAGGDEKLRNAVEAIADMYSYGEILDAIESFYIKNDEQKSAEIARKHAKEFRAMLDDEDEDEMFMGDWGPHLAEEDLDENTTGTGASFKAGAGMGHFGKSKKKRKKTRSGYMGYSEPVNEQEEEEEYSKDVEALEKIIDSKINTKDEWVDMFQLLMSHSDEIQGLSDSQIKSLLQQSLKDI